MSTVHDAKPDTLIEGISRFWSYGSYTANYSRGSARLHDLGTEVVKSTYLELLTAMQNVIEKRLEVVEV